MTLLTIENLSVEFPTRHGPFVAVKDAALTVEPGQIHGLVGESGAGKSTVGTAIMGLLEGNGHITDGNIELNGKTISGVDRLAMSEIRGKRISVIFQDPLTSLNPLFTVGEQLIETISLHLSLKAKQARERAIQLLTDVGIPNPEVRIDQYPHQFSGGMRQRVVIALALCSEPEVIIADEPTTALDVSVQAQILALIRKLANERQVGVILITHDMGVIAETTDVVTVMYMGEVMETGTTAQVLGDPQHEYTKSLIAAVPRADHKLKRFPQISYAGRQTVFKIEDLARNWPATETDGDVLLKVQGIKKEFLERSSFLPSMRRYFTAVNDVSFEIKSGEVFGLVGESGSGKSTIARMIAALYSVDGGDILFDDKSIIGASRDAMMDYRRQIQMIFQDPFSSLNPRHRVRDIVAEPALNLDMIPKSEIDDRVSELLDQVGLGADAGTKFPHQFSGGQRQRIAIARALATQPRFLICDEPTSALDVSIQAQILNILKDLQEHLGLTMLFISHDLPVIRQMCDRVGVLKNGELVEVTETANLFENPQHPYTKELIKLIPKTNLLADHLLTENQL